MEKSDDHCLRETLLEIVDNQLRALDPPETRQTYDRLVAEGYSKKQTRRMLAAAIGVEIGRMMARMESFNRERFAASLHGLPESLTQDVG